MHVPERSCQHRTVSTIPNVFFLVLYCLFHCKEDNLESLQFLQELGYKLKRRVNKLVDACVVTVVQSRRGCSIL